MHVRRRLGRVLALLLASLAVACSRDDGTTLRVLAAASLTDAFEEVADAFEAENPGVDVDLVFGGSSSLREQVLAGAPAGVFAAADEPDMHQLVDAGAAADPQVFATNRLQIVVPAGNPAGVRGLDDFARGELLLGLCAAEVPCGDLARRSLAEAGVTPALDTNEPDVRALLAKVEAGELDAGIVYTTDAASAAGLEGIDIPEELDVTAAYPIAVLTGSEDPGLATRFVRYVLDADAQVILRAYGFGSA